MIQNCCTETNGETKINTKTKRIHQQLTTTVSYERLPQKEIISGTRQRTKTLILSRYGMLECGVNFKGTMSQMCRSCGTLDNETHRLNDCSIYTEKNHAGDLIKSNFDHIYSDDNDLLFSIVNDINKIWEFRRANGCMKRNVKTTTESNPIVYLLPTVNYLLLLNYCTLPVQVHLFRSSFSCVDFY